jgi:signal peptidase I
MSDSSSSSGPSSNSSVVERVEGRRDLIWALILCITVVIAVRSFVIEPFKIPSGSMLPTLESGDQIFVTRFSYGLSFPFTKWEFLPISTPKRGDVVVFLFPRDESMHYIKRVIGLPGDTIEFKGRDLMINGELVPKEPVTDVAMISAMTGVQDDLGEYYRETLGSVTHLIRHRKNATYDFPRSYPAKTVPANEFFVSGDNRDDSYDSRAWGTVPRSNLEGKAQVVWLSFDDQVNWGSLSKVRWNRCGSVIH